MPRIGVCPSDRGESWLAVLVTLRPPLSTTSHDQPEPKRLTPASVICCFRASRPPNAWLTASASAPDGSRPPMGRRMARRLLDGGVDVTVWNRTPERAEGFPARAATPEQAASGAGVAIVMVADGDAVDEVTARLPGELTVVDMSTSGPQCALRL